MHELKTLAHLPLALFDEVAYGKEPIAEIFRRHGYGVDFSSQCIEDSRFAVLVNDRRVELEKTGLVHVHRASAVADLSLTELARRVLDPSTPTPVLLSIYQQTARMGRLEPAQNAVAVSGPGFSISIVMPAQVQKTEKTIHDEKTCIEHDALGELPKHLKALNNDLEYAE